MSYFRIRKAGCQGGTSAGRTCIRESVGLGIGCNHFSAPHILGNEVLLNTDVELGHEPSPGMGAKHGPAAES